MEANNMQENTENKVSETSKISQTINNLKKEDTYSYKGWLNSDNFFKRAFSIYGYSMVASLIIIIPIYAIILICMFAFFSHDRYDAYKKESGMYMQKRGMMEYQGRGDVMQNSPDIQVDVMQNGGVKNFEEMNYQR